jgi:hypothetical protein
MPSETPPRAPIARAVCCFCGTSVELSDPEYTRLAVRWREGDEERGQSWGAHRGCVAALMHERVAGEGPFFDEGVP